MNYATIQEFKDRIDDQVVLQLTTQDGTTVDDQAIQRALDDASATIDGFLERLPAEDRPSAAVLVPYCVDITVYRLARNRPGPDFESIESAFKAAVKFLSEIARNRYPVTGKADGESHAAFTGGPRTFSRGTMGGF